MTRKQINIVFQLRGSPCMRKDSFLKKNFFNRIRVGTHRGQKRVSYSPGLMVVTLTDGCECPDTNKSAPSI